MNKLVKEIVLLDASLGLRCQTSARLFIYLFILCVCVGCIIILFEMWIELTLVLLSSIPFF